MPIPILATKLHLPQPRPNGVARPHLIARLEAAQHCGLRLISAPAGFGKSSLLSEWQASTQQQVAWLALDEGDNDPSRFFSYLVHAIQTIVPTVGGAALALIQAQPQAIEQALINLINEISSSSKSINLVLDDYHVIENHALDQALSYLLEHLPTSLRLVIATREDPNLPLARLRARGQLAELRSADLRFSLAEAQEFLNNAMHLELSEPEVAALEARTEGWIAGLQLAGLSMQHQTDRQGFIASFTGSHHFVMDYLLEEVLQHQPPAIQQFLLHSSILNRMCGSLCDALLPNNEQTGQSTLEYLEQANMFIVALDHERRWYRYHHLFGELLRQRLQRSLAQQATTSLEALHIRASSWFEQNDLEIEAFEHAAAANAIERAERLIEGKRVPLQFQGALLPIMHWLQGLPTDVLNQHPSLWVTAASVWLATGQVNGIEQRLQAAEQALAIHELSPKSQDLIGRIAAIRGTLALSQNDANTIIAQSEHALAHLAPDNLSFRTSTVWKLGYAYQLQGQRGAAKHAYEQAISIGQRSGNLVTVLLASIGLGNLHESDNRLILAATTYQQVLNGCSKLALPAANCGAELGLARIYYQSNQFDLAEQHYQRALQAAQLLQHTDREVACQVVKARLLIAQGQLEQASLLLEQAQIAAQQHRHTTQPAKIAAEQLRIHLLRGQIQAAQQLAQSHSLVIGQAQVFLAQQQPSAALAVLKPALEQAQANDWLDQQLWLSCMQSLVLTALGEHGQALQILTKMLLTAEAEGFVRIFLDHGSAMQTLLASINPQSAQAAYRDSLLAQFARENPKQLYPTTLSLLDLLSQREREVLQLIAQGYSNQAICQQLHLALDTVKGHNRRIFEKLQVQRRTEAVARARELGLLSQ
ncbi:LuxR C-terminal-related transcriptional regulator [Herpetosiphon sp. NSE202]|uniref:LuxR C-terminal-related transcriptional regulator n=1 Tax=Herpetosiphon sp. NSE202 TaxID=3351349 RepID=UPI0036428A25